MHIHEVGGASYGDTLPVKSLMHTKITYFTQAKKSKNGKKI